MRGRSAVVAVMVLVTLLLVVLGVFALLLLLLQELLPLLRPLLKKLLITRRNNRNRFDRFPANELLLFEVENYRLADDVGVVP